MARNFLIMINKYQFCNKNLNNYIETIDNEWYFETKFEELRLVKLIKVLRSYRFRSLELLFGLWASDIANKHRSNLSILAKNFPRLFCEL